MRQLCLASAGVHVHATSTAHHPAALGGRTLHALSNIVPAADLHQWRPTSPPLSPRRVRHTEAVQLLRQFLAAAARGEQPLLELELQQVLASRLGTAAEPAALQPIVTAALRGAADPAAAGDGPPLQPPSQAQLAEAGAGLDALLQLFSPAELLQLLRGAPRLLASDVRGWLAFLRQFGFSDHQIKNLVATSPQVLARGDPATAGAAIMHLKALGCDNDEVRHRVVAFCPQVLAMGPADIDMLIRLWDKFKVGVDERAGM